MNTISEKVSLRYSDKILYLPYAEFIALYPFIKEDLLDEGSYGSVYSSKESVVKVYQEDYLLHDFIVELDAYASNIHPCIIRPTAWSVNNNIAYLALPKGNDLMKAYKEKKISLKQIMHNATSAITFLNSKGVAHCDIKPNNLIYHEGKCKVIDLGLAKVGNLHSDGQYYITGTAYNQGYRDPEYVSEQYNNIKCEIYALAATFVSIYNRHYLSFGELYTYEKGKDKVLNMFVRCALLLQEQRPSIQDILTTIENKCNFSPYIGSILTITLDKKDSTLGYFSSIFSVILQIFYMIELKAETFFLDIDILKRGASFIGLEYPIILVAQAITILAIHARRDTPFSLASYSRMRDDNSVDKDIKLTNTIIFILSSCGGIISTVTAWDQATSPEELRSLLLKELHLPKLERKLYSKCILLSDLISKDEIKTITSEIMTVGTNILSLPNNIERKSCDITIIPDIETLTDIIESQDKVSSLSRVLLHNRSVLSLLPLDVALNAFSSIYNRREDIKIYEFILDNISTLNWRKYGDFLVSDQDTFNPFAKIDESLIESVIRDKRILDKQKEEEMRRRHKKEARIRKIEERRKYKQEERIKARQEDEERRSILLKYYPDMVISPYVEEESNSEEESNLEEEGNSEESNSEEGSILAKHRQSKVLSPHAKQESNSEEESNSSAKSL